MKIGILVGREGTFPQALIGEINQRNPNITAEYIKLGGVRMADTIRAVVDAGIPLPTPWDKEAWEKKAREYLGRRRELIARKAPESEFDALFREQQKVDTPMLAGMAHSGKVGAFEGASYQVLGLYRGQTDCIMFTRDEVGFCPVCRRAIERIIDRETR